MTPAADISVLTFLADHASSDAGGKINALGAAINLMGINPDGGATPPMTLVVVIDFPRAYLDQELPVTIELRVAESGAVVSMPGANGPEAMRFQQMARVDRPQLPAGVRTPQGLTSRVQYVLNFPTGLNLQAGESYRWQVEIDGRSEPAWSAHFHVLAPASGMIFGGPANPPGPDLPSF